MANVHQIDTYSPKFTDTFFFDANVWLFLFGPLASAKTSEQRIYSSFYKQVLQRNCGIFVNSLVLSEFSNVCLRVEFGKWKKTPGNFSKDYKKDFVGTATFKDCVVDIKSWIDIILSKSQRMTDNFNAISLSHVYAEFGKSDFNDAYYIELARMNKWKVVTHDRDLFVNNQSQVDIITGLI